MNSILNEYLESTGIKKGMFNLMKKAIKYSKWCVIDNGKHGYKSKELEYLQ